MLKIITFFSFAIIFVNNQDVEPIQECRSQTTHYYCYASPRDGGDQGEPVVSDNSMVELLKSEFVNLTMRLADLEDQNRELIMRLANLEDQNRELTTRPSDVEYQNRELTTRPFDIEDQNRELTTRPFDVEYQNIELTTGPSDMEYQNRELTTRPSDVEYQNRELTTRPSDVEYQNRELTTRPSDVEYQNRELTTRPSDVEYQNRELTTRPSDVEYQNIELTTRQQNRINIATNCNENYVSASGVYYLRENLRLKPVYCEVEPVSRNWLVFQKRVGGSVDFYRNWSEYQRGFGDVEGNYWLGLDAIYAITSSGSYQLRVDLEDWENNTAYALYSSFSVGNESSNYTLSVSGYSGTAGDSLNLNNNHQFSTFDRDNEMWSGNCAFSYLGAWWYKSCGISNLNGIYQRGLTGIRSNFWWHWKNRYFSLKRSVMKIRPN